MTKETTRMISEEISIQRSTKLNEIKSSLNSQIQDATAIAEKVLPSIQNTISMQGRNNFYRGEPNVQWGTKEPRIGKPPEIMGNPPQVRFYT